MVIPTWLVVLLLYFINLNKGLDRFDLLRPIYANSKTESVFLLTLAVIVTLDVSLT